MTQNLSIVEQCMPRIKTKQKQTVISQRFRLPITSEADICGWVTASKPCPLLPRWPACMSQSEKQTSLELPCQLTKQQKMEGYKGNWYPELQSLKSLFPVRNSELCKDRKIEPTHKEGKKQAQKLPMRRPETNKAFHYKREGKCRKFCLKS